MYIDKRKNKYHSEAGFKNKELNHTSNLKPKYINKALSTTNLFPSFFLEIQKFLHATNTLMFLLLRADDDLNLLIQKAWVSDCGVSDTDHKSWNQYEKSYFL